MADANKNLPLSLEYAQKAVREEEEASAKVQLADLKVEDLAHTSNLAAYWDTLGWVYFRMGNVEQAEKYLDAAWTTSQDPVVADHLGQISEQQHRKQAALHMYRLALAASPGTSHLADFMKQERTRIEHLGGSADARLGIEADELKSMSKIQLPRLISGSASAEFFIMFAPDPRAPGFKVESIQFISGSEKMKFAGGALTSHGFKVLFPDSGPTRLIRRGILGCYQITGCSFVLLNLKDVRSVN
jgi:tetratricopeptide (TPR) repeat protein